MTTQANPNQKVREFQFHKIPKTTKWEDFQKAIYDPDKQELFGRTKKSWGQLLLFYAIFYICLAAFFAICSKGLQSTLNDRQPKYTLEDSLIGTNPGLGFRPMSVETKDGSLIWYNLSDTHSKWVDLIDDFLKPYHVKQDGRNYQECDYTTPVIEGNVCKVEMDKFGPCVSSNQYGYNTNSPCVFLKLNRIFGWEPEFLTQSTPDMPEDVQKMIKTAKETNKYEIWISCRGENAFDRERVAEFRYYPSQGFPGYYFPYINTKNYLSPLIALQIVGVEPHAIVNIECRAWAKNIKYSKSKNNREGSVHFEILVD